MHFSIPDFETEFQDDFLRSMSDPLSLKEKATILTSAWINSPLGPILAISDDKVLYLLDFAQKKRLEKMIKRLKKSLGAIIVPGRSQPIDSIEKELNDYFTKKDFSFKTPIVSLGTQFQKSVWDQLMKIPCGQTRSYRDIAIALGKPTAFRAVALANGSNLLSIIVPCHRVINTNGNIGGYGGGISRKLWLLEYEKSNLA